VGGRPTSVARCVPAVGIACAVLLGAAAAAPPGPGGTIAFDRIASTDPNTGAFHSNIWITTGHGRVRALVKRRGLSAVDVSWSPDGRRIAFAADCSFKYRLACSSVWRMNADGSGLRMLSHSAAADYCPAWSPTGNRIAFTAVFQGAQNVSSGIYVMNLDGSSRTVIDQNELDGCAAWSPDGSEIAFWRANGLYVVNADGSGERQIATGVGRYDAEPDWSPGGSRIAFSKRSRVYVIATDGTGAHAIAHGSSPAWSPDGRRIAFSRNGEIYVVGANGGPPRRATSRRMYFAGHPAWRPSA
jgi:Tol biopolymer transport system component